MPKKVTPLIEDESIKFFESNFRNLNAGVTYILEAFPSLYGRTMHDVKGVFTDGELRLILNVVNGLELTAQIAGKHLIFDVQDGIDLERLDEKWGVSKVDIIKKINNLSLFCLVCLEIWAKSFWQGKRSGQGEYVKMDLDEYVEKLS